MTDRDGGTRERVEQFFGRYAGALLARDAAAVARMYAVPALVLFPGRPVLVTDARQTEEFFASAWDQYEGIDAVQHRLALLAEAPGSVWADVTWSWGGVVRERFCYQLVEQDGEYRIAVLTPMA